MTGVMKCRDMSCHLVRSDFSNLGSIAAELLNDLSVPATNVSQICKVHATQSHHLCGIMYGRQVRHDRKIPMIKARARPSQQQCSRYPAMAHS